MLYEAGCLRALAENSQPPVPPPTLDMPPPSIRRFEDAAKSITAKPFDAAAAFDESAMIEEEYDILVVDHSRLIDFGSSYADFDPLGKLAFLDEIEKIQNRWE